MKSNYQRFIEKVHFSGPGCWEWLASKDKDGYGRFRWGAEKTRAHRAAYMLFKGQIVGDLVVMHSCDNPGCVNPDHLSLGTNADNTADMVAKGRQAKGEAITKGRDYRGERHPGAKITQEQARRILADDRTHSEIADDYGVTRATISHLKRGHTWAHLPR